ncbi:VanZ family protein [Methylobacter marinus]|uniref:VanZ family protein n=1 Tax=Methylobacter marinus TaxID=34058 RepID=UPI0003AA2229|nr:VanZ family protein [Methylobacter marinus]
MMYSKKILLVSGMVYLAFVIYGSLVPLDYRPIPSDVAWARIRQIRYLPLGIASRADWVANILLFIPLTFCWTGIVWHRSNLILKIIGSAIVWLVSVALCLAIEFTQLYFPPRTVSVNDILAESLGGVIGIMLWWMAGERLMNWLNQWHLARDESSRLKRILQAYVVLLFIYNVMPLDLTISPVELYHKWREGRVVLIPFGFQVADAFQLTYNLLTDVLIWVPVALLFVLDEPNRRLQAFVWTLLCALLIELAQLFVYSRITDITDLITASVGAGAGIWLGTRLNKMFKPEKMAHTRVYAQPVPYLFYGCAGFIVWSILLTVMFWYPFDFRIERDYVSVRLARFWDVPFTAYYYSTEFRALTELCKKIVFFMPLGGMVSVIAQAARHERVGLLLKWVGFVSIAAVATGIELGQIALPGRSPNNTDIVIEIIGALLGYRLWEFVRGRIRRPAGWQAPGRSFR